MNLDTVLESLVARAVEGRVANELRAVHDKLDMILSRTGSDLLSIPKAAAYSKFSEGYLRREIKARRLDALGAGKSTRIRRSVLDTFIARKNAPVANVPVSSPCPSADDPLVAAQVERTMAIRRHVAGGAGPHVLSTRATRRQTRR